MDLLAALRRLIAEGEVDLEIDAGKLGHMDSPVAVQAEANRWLVLLVAACGAAFWFAGWAGGGGAVALSVAVWFAYVRRALHRRIERRVHAQALDDVQTWRRLWRFGGMRLLAGGAVCAAPDGNWMQFVRERRAATAP